MARWIRPNEYEYPFCSECGRKCLTYQDYECLSPFCPNCGAKMEESMKYSLIYHDKWSSLVMGKYDTYGEALLAMLEARKRHEKHHGYNIVRYEIREDCYYA